MTPPEWKWSLLVAILGFGYSSALTLPPVRAAEPGKGSLRILVRESRGGKEVPARVHLVGPDGEAIRAPGLPFFRDHFNCEGEVTLELEEGIYEYTVERGPEYRRVRGTADITRGKASVQRVVLERIVDLSRRGWWSGD